MSSTAQPQTAAPEVRQDLVKQKGYHYRTKEELTASNPSLRDGLTPERLEFFRKTYCTLLQDAGMRLSVPQLTIATATVFCHRFFAVKSMQRNDRFVVATACLHLACKVEETVKALRDVIRVCFSIRNKKNPAALEKLKDKQFAEDLREHVLMAERAVLYTLGFDFSVEHPYMSLLKNITTYKLNDKVKDLPQVAWNFVNDSLRTTLCLQYSPEDIATTCLYLSLKLLKLKIEPLDNGKQWWEDCGTTASALEDISQQIMVLYETNKGVPEKKGGEGAGGEGRNGEAPSTTKASADGVPKVHTPQNEEPAIKPDTHNDAPPPVPVQPTPSPAAAPKPPSQMRSLESGELPPASVALKAEFIKEDLGQDGMAQGAAGAMVNGVGSIAEKRKAESPAGEDVKKEVKLGRLESTDIFA